ncbi:MAG: serine/threonine-protein kinase [Pirellulaceae bacterium]|nr:serine/threonine-protein kinase [Pirellulaceae bacterium]
MPKVTSTEKLIELIKRSELIGKDELADFLATRAAKSKGLLPPDHHTLANELIGAGLITSWQMEQLLKGKYRGFRLGKYTLKGHLGTGGMSSVYLSEHPIMRRPVAIKVLPKSRVSKSSYLERFELEARAVAALDHPNIVRAYDIDNEGDTHYIVMEYVEGKDFQRIVEQEGVLAFERAADCIAQAAAGLQHAHEAGVVHRDIKPANCLVDRVGVVKVLDMGLAKFSQDEKSLSSVHKDSVVGTADYLAPEQAVNSSKVDARADIYGLGGTLYFLLTGHPPFPEGTLTERLLKHQREEPASIFEDRSDAPATLVDVCRRMMMKNPNERVQTAAGVVEQLRHWLAGRGYGEQPTGSTPPRIGAGNDGETTNRLERLVATSALPETEEKTSDTVSANTGDTAAIGGREEDLTLAPIDEEEARPEAATSSSDAIDIDIEDRLDETVLSQIEEEIGTHNSASGSLVDLLENNSLSSASATGILLRRKRPAVPIWMWGISVVAVLIVVLLFLAIIVW